MFGGIHTKHSCWVPIFLFVFGGIFNLAAMLGIAISLLSFVRVPVWGFS